ncbi:uncharacterized protein LOC116104739 [Mastomys coucha]|uniref:uncharacterized protein LOC116104739 n=1 Tax=Mastomys coucha TaxID=35658 RepID=UPI001261DB1C|nr:uncharacterized protein LOC116104739 [Mastomys coucha]
MTRSSYQGCENGTVKKRAHREEVCSGQERVPWAIKLYETPLGVTNPWMQSAIAAFLASPRAWLGRTQTHLEQGQCSVSSVNPLVAVPHNDSGIVRKLNGLKNKNVSGSCVGAGMFNSICFCPGQMSVPPSDHGVWLQVLLRLSTPWNLPSSYRFCHKCQLVTPESVLPDQFVPVTGNHVSGYGATISCRLSFTFGKKRRYPYFPGFVIAWNRYCPPRICCCGSQDS